MTYEEFLKLAKKSEQYKEKTLPITSKWYYDKKKDNKAYPMFFTEVETGGWGGGNCWGDEAESYSCNYKLEDLNIDFLLKELTPNITYLEYKNLIKQLDIHKGSRTESEYYGNSTNYEYHYILIIDLYNKFKELNII